jgi:enoyl-CoA hydratase/carnithine racemase
MGQEFENIIQNIRRELSSGSMHVNAIVLTGAGDQAFSAGGNVEWLRGLKDKPVYENADAMMSFYQSFLCTHLSIHAC